jgi:hypothetical protein
MIMSWMRRDCLTKRLGGREAEMLSERGTGGLAGRRGLPKDDWNAIFW